MPNNEDIHAPEIGDRGFMRCKHDEIGYADVQSVRTVATKSGDKYILSVLLFNKWVRTGDLKEDIEVGTGENEWWHSLSDLRCVVDRARQPKSSSSAGKA